MPIISCFVHINNRTISGIIRSDKDINGFKVNREEYKINLFADDVLIYFTEPEKSLRKLYTRLREYGIVSGYKVNWDKSEIMPHTADDYSQCKRDTQFKWPTNGIKFLGVKVENNLKNLYKLNYLPLFKKIDEDVTKWMEL